MIHDLLMAHLLGGLASITCDGEGFIRKVLGSVALDLQAEVEAAGTPIATPFAYSMKTLQNFTANIAPSLGGGTRRDLS